MTLAETIEQAMSQAMSQAVLAVQAESEAIAAEGELTAEEKAAAIEAINEPGAVQARMLEARAAAKAAWEAAASQEEPPTP